MENFKKALKQAIVEKAEGVRFEVGHSPAILLFASELSLGHLSAMDQHGLEELIQSLLPGTAAAPGSLREGTLSIVNFGEVKLLADGQNPPRLFAFIPPQGNQLYQQIKSNLVQGTPRATPPRPIDLPTSGADPAFEPLLRPGHFAMNSPGQPPIPSAGHPGKFEETSLQAPQASGGSSLGTGLPPPPRQIEPVREASQAWSAAIAQSVESPDAHFSEKSQTPTQISSPSSHQMTKLRPPSDTDGEDYHFNQNLSSVGRSHNSEFTSTYASAVLPTPTVAPAPEPARPIIYFGPSIPGDSIERTGRLPIDNLLVEMVKRRASDLHMTLGEPPCMRIDGEIQRISDQRISEEEMRDFLLPIMPRINRQEFAETHDTDFAYEVPQLARFRVNIFRDRQGVGAVLRQIPDRVLSADELGLPPAIRKLCELQKGLVVVTGPTGSGKSTTLAAMIDLINESRSDHILTIEDPIEFVHKQKKCLINQREVHKHTSSFSRALRAALREDPDIVLIGEMRDLETVEIAIETAETGHLVFGTLHTNTAISTVDRLIDQFPADQQEQVRVMLSESLKGVVAQTLVKKKGGGRVAAHEILIVDKAVASLIREGNTHMVQNHMLTQKAKGNIQLNEALATLVTKGLVDPKEAYLKAVEKESFTNLLQQKGITLEAPKNAS